MNKKYWTPTYKEVCNPLIISRTYKCSCGFESFDYITDIQYAMGIREYNREYLLAHDKECLLNER